MLFDTVQGDDNDEDDDDDDDSSILLTSIYEFLTSVIILIEYITFYLHHLASRESSSTYGSWYRVATAEKDADKQVQSLSVTTEEVSTLRGSGGVAASGTKKPKVYHDQFNAESLPLDGDFDGEELSVGKALRHGWYS